MSDSRSYIALDWVTQEIIETLNQALAALQGYISNPQDITKLRFSITYLHQVAGGLVMVELHGASLLAKEIEILLSRILANNEADNSENIAVAKSAINALSAYIERVSKTHQDTPQDLLQALNAIRTQNQQVAFSAADVFDPNIAPARTIVKQKPRMAAADFNELIRKLRQAYKIALTGLQNDTDINKNLLLVNKVFAPLYKVSKSTVSEPLWQIAAAIAENLHKVSQALNEESKKALTTLSAQIDLLAEQGVDGLSIMPESALLKSLLYSVATAENRTEQIRVLQKQYKLDQALEKPATETRIENKVLQKFIASIVEQIDSQHAKTAIAQALSLLASVDPALQPLQASQSDSALVEALNQYTVDDAIAEQFFAVYTARINESRTIIDAIKEQIIAYINAGFAPEDIQDLPELLSQQMQALDISSLHALVPVLDAARRYIVDLLQATDQPESQALESLADAISGVDYYLECVTAEQREKLDSIVALAQQRMQALGYETTVLQPTADTSEEVTGFPQGEITTEAAEADSGEFFLLDEEEIDEEILEIFIEEGAEVIEHIRENLPKLAADYNNIDALLEIRRSFHTLKGSGRMVGATHIGDFAWAIEQMLNKVRDGLSEVTANAIAIIGDATDQVPGVLKALEEKTPYPINQLQSFITRADAEWQNPQPAEQFDELTATLPVEDQQSLDAIGESTADDQPCIDAELLEIFIAEAETHITAFADFLENINPGYEDVRVSAELQRALHTLKGSAHMADIVNIANLATPLESFVKDMSNFQTAVDGEMLALFIRSCDMLQLQLQYLRDGHDKAVDKQDELIEEIRQNHAERLEVHHAEATETRGIADKYTALLSQALDCMTDGADLLMQWQTQGIDAPQQQELINNMQALADTASSASYPEVAAVAGALAAFYQRAMANVEALDEQFFALANQGHDELDDMMDIIAAQQLVEPADGLIEALNQGPTFITLTPAVEQDADDSEVALPLAEVESFEDDSFDTIAIDSADSDASQQAAIVQFAQQIAVAEEELLEIFTEEVAELLELLEPVVAESLEQQQMEAASIAEIKRILHTLKGGARLAELSVLGDVTHDYETMLEQAEARQQFDATFFQQMAQYQQQLLQLIDFILDQGTLEQAQQIAASTPGFIEPIEPTEEAIDSPLDDSATEDSQELQAQGVSMTSDQAIQSLMEELAQADKETIDIFMEELLELGAELDTASAAWLADKEDLQQANEIKRVLHTIKGGARMAELKTLGNVTHDYESMIELAEAQQAFDDAFFADLQQFQDQVQSLIDTLNESLSAAAAAIIEPQLTMTMPSVEVQPESSAAPAAATVKLTISPDADADMLALFMEEAKEQSEGIEEAIGNFFKNNQDQEPLEELKRLLHTLKGGARMVGIKEIGDVSHDFETYIINSEREGTTQQDDFIDGLQAFHEQSAELIQALSRLDEKAEQESQQKVASNIVPIRPDIDVSGVSQAAIEATRSFIESFNKEQQRSTREAVRVAPEMLENLTNLAGENIIGRSRLEEQMSELRFSLDDMDMTVDRLHGQLRRLEIETEAQITFRQEQVGIDGLENFDPLEMDRYSHMQQLSKSLIEAASDIDDLSATFTNKMRDMETLLIQQARVNTDLQEGLMRLQMVPFSRMVPRLRRIVRQIAQELGKKVEFSVENAEGELDRTILEKMVAPLEHMLRNAVDHGIEMPAERKKNGKEETGSIVLAINREGGEVVLTLRDNGAGVNLPAVRKKAMESGLLSEGAEISDHEVMQFILHAGFSTAQQVTQISGRGVGMDVVHSEIKQMGGSVEVTSIQGQGSVFTIRLPFTVSVNRALMVCIGNDTYAIPLNTIEGIVRVSPYELEAYYQPDAPLFDYAGQSYNLRYLGTLLHRGSAKIEEVITPLPVILIRSSDYTVAVQVDRLLGSQEIVVKSLGPQFSMVQGISGATVLGDGSVVIILDMIALIRSDISRGLLSEAAAMSQDTYVEPIEHKATRVMVVDDSVTVRKVTSRLLERYGIEVLLAKDGLDAITQLQELEQLPDIMLLDIEMPRMDGFEVVSRVRHNNRLQGIPIVMITSRTGEKHRERALSLGANRYLGKPFQESELLQVIGDLTGVEILQA